MSYGLITADGSGVLLKKIECRAEVMGEYGFYTLTQHYLNDSGVDASVKYVFPIPHGSIVSGFRAEVNGEIFSSSIVSAAEADKITAGCRGSISLRSGTDESLEVFIGVIPPEASIVIQIDCLCTSRIEDNTTRIVIPTVIAPRYISFGKQLALESVMSDTMYTMSLALTYRGKDILNVFSPTHEINSSISPSGAEISLKNPASPNRDIIIDVELLGKNRPVMYHNNSIAYYSFTPKIDLYRKSGRSYMFLLDISASMDGEKIKQAKNALSLCLRCMQPTDMFNIIAFKTQYQALGEQPLTACDKSLRLAEKWLDELKAEGGTEILHPIMRACESDADTILLFTDGQVQEYPELIRLAEQSKTVFYTFGIDSAVNAGFLVRLANTNGGRFLSISPTERIDEAIMRSFNKIAVHTVKNAVISFDAPTLDVTPKVIKQIHAGQRVTVMAGFRGTPPRQLTVTGDFAGVRLAMQVQFENPSASGEEISKFFAKAQIDLLENSLTGEQARDDSIKAHISRLSVEYGILSAETAFVLKTNLQSDEKIIQTIVPSPLPHTWKATALPLRETPRRGSSIDKYIKLIKTQRADGSFRRHGADTLEHTAATLDRLCLECGKPELFVWQLRKAAAFILSALEAKNYSVIPEFIVSALESWHNLFGGNDEISQKVSVLVYLYRKI